MTHTRRRNAFTLIEVLVVISVVALLISILLPTMKAARRQAMVTECMSNLKQIGIGLANHVVENDGQYPTPASITPNIIYTQEAGLNAIDNRPVLYEIAGKRAAELYFCPVVGTSPADDVGTTPWSHEFGAMPIADRHGVNYSMFFLITESVPGWDWSWSNSGNPDTNGDGQPDGPYEWGRSNAAVIADHNGYWPPGGNSDPDNWDNPEWANHSGFVYEAPFRDSNVLFGDGHATVRSTLVNYVERAIPGNTAYYSY